MKNFIENLFSREKVNVGRQYEIDLLRGLCFLVLCICHAGLYLSVDTHSGMYYFADIIGSEPAAPVFATLMGVCVIYSPNQSPVYFLKRGIKLLIIGSLLNLYRSFPYWITGDLDYFACVPGFFVVDILLYSALTMLLFALFKKLKMPYWAMFIVSVCFLIIGQILMTFPRSLEFPTEATYILNFFLPINNVWCCFNLSTWFIFPCFGLILGQLLIRCKDKNKFYLILLIIGSIGAIALYLNIGLRFPNYIDYYYGKNYFKMGVLNVLITLLFVSFLLSLCFFLSKILPSMMKKCFIFISKNITVCFVFSWILLCPIIHIQAYYEIVFPNIVLVGFMIALIVISPLLSLLYRNLISYIKTKMLCKNKI